MFQMLATQYSAFFFVTHYRPIHTLIDVNSTYNVYHSANAGVMTGIIKKIKSTPCKQSNKAMDNIYRTLGRNLIQHTH